MFLNSCGINPFVFVPIANLKSLPFYIVFFDKMTGDKLRIIATTKVIREWSQGGPRVVPDVPKMSLKESIKESASLLNGLSEN